LPQGPSLKAIAVSDRRKERVHSSGPLRAVRVALGAHGARPRPRRSVATVPPADLVAKPQDAASKAPSREARMKTEMPRSPWRFCSPLRSHDFDDGAPLKGREPGRLFVCRNCLRRFKFDSSAQRTWAVGKGRGFRALERSVSGRWLSEECAGGPSHADEEDSKRIASRVAHYRASPLAV
jgi:hypothetical protein